MVQLYSKVNDPLDVGTVTKQEMANESKEMQRVFDENKSLREQVELLKSQSRYMYTNNNKYMGCFIEHVYSSYSIV